MTKAILILRANGEITELPSGPTLAEMQDIVGGYVEHVRVLDRIENGRFVYTSMFINDEGLLNGLPRNPNATEAYQRNVRAQFAGEIEPFKAAEEQFRNEVKEGGFALIEALPGPEEYDPNDPHIAGDVILFQGYTCQEVDDLLSGANRQREGRGR
jgi:hypothetical protein